MNKAILIMPVIAILLGAIPSAMAETNSQRYNNGYNDGWYTAQSDWNNNVYGEYTNGNPNQGCTSHHTQQYCNGYYEGYSKLWAQWQYNLAHGLNLVNSPTQDQTSGVNTNIKGNDNTVTNIINQGQASNSPNTASSGYGGNR
jgi:hypothetical protein